MTYDYLYENINAQGGFDLQDLPQAARVNPAEAFAIGYGAQYSETTYGASQLINTQYSNNRRKALELGLDLPEIRRVDGSYVDGEEFSKYFSGEESGVSQESIDAYESKMKTIMAAHPEAGFSSLRSIWDATRNTAQTFSQAADEERMGLVGGAAYLLGSMAGFGADPVNAATLAIGAGPIAGARTIGTVGKAVIAEGAIQAGVEATQEVRGQAAMRERLGLDGGFGSSAMRVGGAFAFGGAFRGASEALMAGVGRALGREVGVVPLREVEDGVPQGLWGEAITGKKEIPSRIDTHIEETAKLNALAEHIEPMAKDSPSVTARVLEDLEAVRAQADDWSAPPLWSKEFYDSLRAGDAYQQRVAELQGTRVVDEQGAPLSVYHGTGKEFDEYNTTGEGKSRGTGTWFSSSPEAAGSYAPTSGGNIRQAKLNLRRPLEVHMEGQNWHKIDGKTRATTPEGDVRIDSLVNEFDINTDKVARWARENGYDGVIFRKMTDRGPYRAETTAIEPSDVYSVFKAKSIIPAVDARAAAARAADPDAPLRARAGNATPAANETMADTVVRVTKEQADTLEENLDSFIMSLSRALDEKGDLVLGKGKVDLDTKIDVPFDDAEGFKEMTVREFLEQARMADESEKAVKTCLI